MCFNITLLYKLHKYTDLQFIYTFLLILEITFKQSINAYKYVVFVVYSKYYLSSSNYIYFSILRCL